MVTPFLRSMDPETNSSSSKSSYQSNIPIESSKDVVPLVLVPGPGPGKCFLKLSQALGVKSSDFSLPTTWDEQGRQDSDGMVATGLLSKVSGLIRVKALHTFELWAKRREAESVTGSGPYRPFHAFVYDWRREIVSENMPKLLVFLQEIREKYNGARIQVVTHSFGQALIIPIVNALPEMFHSLCCVAPCWKPGLPCFERLLLGVQFTRRLKIPAEVISTWMSGGGLLCPVKGVEWAKLSGSYPLILDEQGHELDINFFSSSDWRKYRIAQQFCDSKMTEAEKKRLEGFLQHFMDRNIETWKLSMEVPDVYPPVASVSCNTFATMSRAMYKPEGVSKNKPNIMFDFDAFAKVPGDGVLAHFQTEPLKGIPATCFEMKGVEHANALGDTDRLEEVLEFLDEEAMSGVKRTPSIHEKLSRHNTELLGESLKSLKQNPSSSFAFNQFRASLPGRVIAGSREKEFESKPKLTKPRVGFTGDTIAPNSAHPNSRFALRRARSVSTIFSKEYKEYLDAF